MGSCLALGNTRHPVEEMWCDMLTFLNIQNKNKL